MKIIPLSEGSFTVDKTKQFVPFEKGVDELNHRPVGSLLVEIQPFCIVTGNDIIIIDTGLGFSMPDGTLQIHHNLMAHDINPMEVTKVLMSHLHKDHAGAIFKKDPILQQQFFSFPNATHYVNRNEFEFALQKGQPSFDPDSFQALEQSDRLVFTEDKGIIDGYIHYEVTGAHSPFHQVFMINADGKKTFFGGDVAPQLQQMKSRFVAKYDYDGKKSMELRQQWWQQGKEENWTFLFYHDIKTPIAEL